ncbi:MAG: IS66 family transposase, partial [Sporomusa sp.]
MLENEKLKKENRILRGYKAEAMSLRAKIDALESSIAERIEEAVAEAVAKATAPLLAKIDEQEKEIQRLKSQINKDSSNSSKPPSMNGFRKPANNREQSTRQQGGQVGHKGNRLNIPENLEELKIAGKIEHRIIYEGISEGEAYVSDFEINLKIVPEYIETRRAAGAPPQISYGEDIRALAVYLSLVGLISIKRLTEFFSEITYGMANISKATVAKFINVAAERVDLHPFIQELLNGEVVHVDETPIKTTERPNDENILETARGTTFNAYIRTYSNEKTTILTANPRKTEESVKRDDILTQFHGIVAQDHESKFYNFGDKHATCGAHLSRELKGLAELNLLDWAAEFRVFFVGMNTHKNKDLAQGISTCDPVLLAQFESQYDELLERGVALLAGMKIKSFGSEELLRMTNRLTKHKDNYMLFIRNYTAPFTNNQAERDLRHCKTKQKI